MEIPGYPGVSRWRIELADFYLKRDGKIRISFDVKMGPDVNGVFHPENRYGISFRCNRDETKHKRYPLLTGFYFRPEKEWKHFSRTFDVKAYSMYYAVWITTPNIPHGSAANTLWFDNFRVEYVDGERKADAEFAAILIDAGARTTHQDKTSQWNVFHKAAAENMGIKTLSVLVREKSGLNAHDRQGRTPLHLAVSRTPHADFQVVEFLLKNKAEVNALDGKGRTPLDLTRQKDIVNLLIRYGGRSNKGRSGSISKYKRKKR